MSYFYNFQDKNDFLYDQTHTIKVQTLLLSLLHKVTLAINLIGNDNCICNLS